MGRVVVLLLLILPRANDCFGGASGLQGHKCVFRARGLPASGPGNPSPPSAPASSRAKRRRSETPDPPMSQPSCRSNGRAPSFLIFFYHSGGSGDSTPTPPGSLGPGPRAGLPPVGVRQTARADSTRPRPREISVSGPALGNGIERGGNRRELKTKMGIGG